MTHTIIEMVELIQLCLARAQNDDGIMHEDWIEDAMRETVSLLKALGKPCE